MSDNNYNSKPSKFNTVPPEVASKVRPLWENFKKARNSGDNKIAEESVLAAWNELPEPKLGWNMYANVIPYALVEFYRDLNRFEDSEEWLELARQSYGPGRNASVEFLAATVAFEKGDMDAAFEEFNQLYSQFGKRPFVGAADKYLEFTLERRGK